MLVEPFEQVAGFALLAAAPFLLCVGGKWWQGIVSIAFIEDLLIARFKAPDLRLVKMVGGLSGFIDGVFDMQQASRSCDRPSPVGAVHTRRSTRVDGERCIIHGGSSSRSTVSRSRERHVR